MREGRDKGSEESARKKYKKGMRKKGQDRRREG
jgi:hypothetical protein